MLISFLVKNLGPLVIILNLGVNLKPSRRIYSTNFEVQTVKSAAVVINYRDESIFNAKIFYINWCNKT